MLAPTHAGCSSAGAASSESPIGRYAAALALLVLGEEEQAATTTASLAGAEAIPPAVTETLTALAACDAGAYGRAIRALLTDFEGRDDFLEDTRVADTVLALQALAAERGLAARDRVPAPAEDSASRRRRARGRAPSPPGSR